MSGPDALRPLRADRERAPVRLAHLGLGAFHRAHQAWYTAVAPDRNEWGIAAFTGRSPQAADDLRAQDCLYSLVTRSADRDDVEVIDSIVTVDDGARVDRLVEVLSTGTTSLVTLTITETGYALASDGRPDESLEAVRGDIDRLPRMLSAARLDPSDGARSALGRLLVGLEARRRADAGPIAIVPCDNLPGNGDLVRRGLRALAERVHPPSVAFIDEHVSFVSTSVDRITPKTTAADVETVARLTGRRDHAPVVTEPFHDWVLSGTFPAGRPGWEHGGARFVSDIEPFERRKLWLLNAAHSLLAYTGAARGHSTVDEAMGDAEVRSLVDQLWDEACRHLTVEDLDLEAYRRALRDRFDNDRIRHSLAQIGQEGVAKLRVRVAPILLAERAEGREAPSSVAAFGAWVAAARAGALPADRSEAAIRDAASAPGDHAVARLLGLIEPTLADDPAIVRAVDAAAREHAAR